MPGNIDQLNFEVIIKDDEFNEKVKADIEAAKQLNVELTALLDMQAKAGKFKLATGTSAKSATELQRLRKATTDAAAAEERLAAAKDRRASAAAKAYKATTQALSAQTRLTSALHGTTAAANRQGRIFGELKNMALSYLSIRGASQFIQSMVRITGEFELQKVALGSMIGDLNQAKVLIADIQQLALQSPFAFKELTTYAKQLAAFSVPANELLETTKMLADVSAGLGVGMDRIVLAYGQIRSAAFLRGQEVRQLTEAGIPILQELAKQFSEIEGRAVSAGEVFDKISARLVPFEMVAKVFKDMTSEGGKFFEMQEIQAETLKGKIANLKDAYEMMLNEIGSGNDESLKKWVDRLRDLMLNWEKVGAVLKTIIVSLGAYKAALAMAAVYEKAMLAMNVYRRWHLLNVVVKNATGHVNKFATALKILGPAAKMAAGVGLAAVAGLITAIISATKNSQRLNKELEKIGGEAEEKVNNVTNDIERLGQNLRDAIKGTQEYRDAISELNRKYGDYLPKILSEADAYYEVSEAVKAAEEAIRNKARADAEAEGKAAIEKEFGQDLRDAADNFYNSMVLVGAGGISKKMARSIKEAFDTALLEEGAEDNIFETFKRVADTFLGGEGEFLKLYDNLLQINSDAANRLAERVVNYGEQSLKVKERMEDLQADLDDRFYATFKTREEAIKVEEIEAQYRGLVDELKKVYQTQEEYDEELRKLDIDRLEKLAKVYEELGRPEIAKGFSEQAKALKGLQDGWRGVINETLKGLGFKKGTSFGLWADEFTQSTEYVDKMLKRYQEIEKEISLVGSFDADKVEALKNEKKAIEEVTKALKINLRALLESKKTTTEEESEELKLLKKQIDLVKKLKSSYGELREFLDDGQMRRILKSLFPEAEDEWLANLDFDAVLKKMADELEKYDDKAAANLRNSIGKDAAKDLADLFEAFMKYKEAVDEWKVEDFNFYGGDEVGKVLRDLSKEYEEIDRKRRKTLELLRKAEAGDAEAIALLRTTLGEEVWKSYVTNGKAAIEALANEERDVARKTAEEKAKDKAAEMLKNRMERENVDLKEFSDKSIAQVRKLLADLAKIKSDIDNEISALEEGGLTEEEKIRLAELREELKLLAKETAEAGEELDKKLTKSLKQSIEETTKALSGLAKEVSEFGEALDSERLAEWGGNLSDIASAAGDLASKVIDLKEELKGVDEGTAFKDLSAGAKAVIIGIAVTALTMVYKSAKKAILAYLEHQDALTEATRKYRDILIEIRRENFSNIFGTDEMAKAAENARILAEAEEEYAKSLEKVNEAQSRGLYLLREGGVSAGLSLADKLKEISLGQGWDLYLADGQLNIDAIEQYFDSYKRSLSRKQKKLIEELIENSKALDDAAAQQAEYLTDLFSGVADSIADSMIDAFLESGNAAIDMGEIMSDVAKNMAADLLKSIMFERVFNEYKDALQDVWNKTDIDPEQRTKDTLDVLNKAMEEIAALAPEFQKILEEIDYLQIGEGAEDGNLGTGIKNITEDTANLLASYLNAIRADVSYARVIWERMDTSMQQIAAALSGFSAPSLMEYQAQIASNTYNTMLNTQSILSRLESVMDYESGSASIRVV